MSRAAFRNIGWRSGASIGHEPSRAQLIMLYARRALLCASTLVLCIVIASDTVAMQAVLNRFDAIHVALGAALGVAAMSAALTVVSGFAGVVLFLAEALPRFAVGGAMMGMLPFAQASDPSPAAQPGKDGATSLARSEIQVGLYMGKSHSPRSDVHLTSPDGTDMTLTDIEWKPESFKPSPYYGGRGIDWNSRMPRLGIMVDFTHAKATAIRSQTVTHHGKHKGVEVPPSGPFEAIFRKLEFTHGLNYLTLNGMFRATGLHRRVVPYVGLGIGFMVPHADAWRAGQDKKDVIHGAQITGVAAQVLGGIEWRVFKSDRKSLFTEYKLAYTANDVTLKDGGSVIANIWVHQVIFGGYYTPWRAGDAAARQ